MKRFVDKIFKRGSLFLLAGIGRIMHAVRLKRYYQHLLVRLVERTGLFDEAYYHRNNPDVAADGYPPIWHYVAYGDRENRLPMPLFDPGHYRRNAGRYRTGSMNTLLHYTFIGRYEGYATSPWFDTAYYLNANRDVKFNGMDPLRHFMKFGGREGRSPCVTFDASRYLLSHPEIAGKAINPLLHHLGYTPKDGGAVWPRGFAGPANLRTTMPAAHHWSALPRESNERHPVVDVIVPVYRGRIETLRCIYSVLRFAQRTAFELVVINDASPDERLTADLAGLAATHLFTYLANDRNLGYVATVNRGLLLHPDRDAVLLNADTEPCNDWLDRLRTAAYRHPRTATVTPLSNNATICSYPDFDRDNPSPLEVSNAKLDRLARQVNAGWEAETPTAVGFCMYIKRDCLNEVGLFDELAFGAGYGEENDFCQRAIEKNWRHVITPDVFVWHWGARSFKGEKGSRIRRALRLVEKRYPNYRSDVAGFIAADPLRKARQRIDEARLTRKINDVNVLVITHNRGGGTARSVRAYARQLRQQGAHLFFLNPSVDRHIARLTSEEASHLPNLDPIDFRHPRSYLKMLRKYRITRVHVHQLIDLDLAAASVIAKCTKMAGARLEIFVHDYQAICPRINLVDSSGLYCGEPRVKVCKDCLKKSLAGEVRSKSIDIHDWRRRFRLLYAQAEVVNVPNEDVQIRLNHWAPELRIAIRPPELLSLADRTKAPFTIEPDAPLRIVVIGAIVAIKGYDVLKACAKDAQQRHLPLEFVVMGYTKNDAALSRLGVTVTGRYWDSEAPEKLKRLAPNLVWLPSVWPETYSYTLSLALSAGIDVAAFDLGAIAQRLRTLDRGDHLHPLAWARKPERINNYFLRVRRHKIRDARLRAHYRNRSERYRDFLQPHRQGANAVYGK